MSKEKRKVSEMKPQELADFLANDKIQQSVLFRYLEKYFSQSVYGFNPNIVSLTVGRIQGGERIFGFFLIMCIVTLAVWSLVPMSFAVFGSFSNPAAASLILLGVVLLVVDFIFWKHRWDQDDLSLIKSFARWLGGVEQVARTSVSNLVDLSEVDLKAVLHSNLVEAAYRKVLAERKRQEECTKDYNRPGDNPQGLVFWIDEEVEAKNRFKHLHEAVKKTGLVEDTWDLYFREAEKKLAEEEIEKEKRLKNMKCECCE
ncbi:MAG: hypothetical protein A2114_01845 [Candidatus Vogelbacteria bacterium GWA1_51_14]|uniref:Uncharacterized protein n=1 Tax=Candidatus Vogelbacteria bacterium GWA1_51_14 TaxID=1802435 RepID=A0A1G2QAY3_9BACT|nr:MAG: hypothetical protein A2114_01845 [Candidatus Vogelbacteria bacterium GWA1_51_14]